MKRKKNHERNLQKFLLCTLVATLTVSACTEEAHSVQHRSSSQVRKPILVAVIDTGVDADHRVLKDFIFHNSGEMGKDAEGRDKSNNQIDDDGNGFIDDVHGWNFARNNNNTGDLHGHGTHVTGLIVAANERNSIKILPIKYFETENSENSMRASLQAIHYAVQMKVDVINYSGGGTEPGMQELYELKEAEKAGIIVVAAAGNEGKSSKTQGFYPAFYPLNNIISVAACDKDRTLLRSSNFGNKVTFIENGKNILSTLPNNKFGFLTGTSQATAIVTGWVTLLKAKNPRLNAESIIERLASTGEEEPQWLGKAKYNKKINIQDALLSFSKTKVADLNGLPLKVN